MLVFVSYKSEDANLVRGVAERMTANGVSLWFAEYEVLPETYERFQEAIDEGIQNASHGLIFTNARWADSEYCRYEMAHLLERIPPGKITEVC
ncbi:MAG: toll/interleukin-1 receptor domain-containing protein, partial [Gemmatimonadota bacterium]